MRNLMSPLDVMLLVKEMRDSQKRWPMHPVQGSIETMALEKKVDEALEPYIDYIKQVDATT